MIIQMGTKARGHYTAGEHKQVHLSIRVRTNTWCFWLFSQQKSNYPYRHSHVNVSQKLWASFHRLQACVYTCFFVFFGKTFRLWQHISICYLQKQIGGVHNVSSLDVVCKDIFGCNDKLIMTPWCLSGHVVVQGHCHADMLWGQTTCKDMLSARINSLWEHTGCEDMLLLRHFSCEDIVCELHIFLLTLWDHVAFEDILYTCCKDILAERTHYQDGVCEDRVMLTTRTWCLWGHLDIYCRFLWQAIFLYYRQFDCRDMFMRTWSLSGLVVVWTCCLFWLWRWRKKGNVLWQNMFVRCFGYGEELQHFGWKETRGARTWWIKMAWCFLNH